MKMYNILIGMLLVFVCITVIHGITKPANTTTEFVFNDYVEETSAYGEALTRFVVENYDELSSMEVEFDY